MLPVGREITWVIPATLVTPIWALCGLIPQIALALGFQLPVSASSTVEAAPCEISDSPISVPASIIPG